jgi:hypothetical protein
LCIVGVQRSIFSLKAKLRQKALQSLEQQLSDMIAMAQPQTSGLLPKCDNGIP